MLALVLVLVLSRKQTCWYSWPLHPFPAGLHLVVSTSKRGNGDGVKLPSRNPYSAKIMRPNLSKSENDCALVRPCVWM